MSHFRYYFFNAVKGFVFFALLYILLRMLWWQFFPYQTASVVTPMAVLNKNNIVMTPEKLNLEVLFTKYTDVSPEVHANIVCEDGSIYLMDLPRGRSRPVGTFRATPSYEIPEQVPEGVYCIFEFKNDYQVNPIRVISKEWQSVPFRVFRR